ncbi:glutamate receptor ionotropic, kainate 2 [Patella vulgata]|uniref:glutamate receptor ionotropic, kainate 2 n=1 Tax=Patella vulgata TaxID=6465 RepID=UPI002180089D|nr:glutamate receptor ionotropic, kainate 2 [Patella vulgata]XP_050390803.1 glutamate receptor ionotropic, kainate 2 [Patella vulgata]
MYRTSVFLGGIVFYVCLNVIHGLPDKLRVGALFEPEFEGQKQAFEWAVEQINLRTDILGESLVLDDDQIVQAQDSFGAQRKVCRMVHQGVAAIFGPISSLSAAHVQSMCNAFEIPHLQWHWDPRDSRDYYSISLYPNYLTLSGAYKDVVKHWGWDEFTVLYEDNDGLTRLQEVLKAPEGNTAKLTVRKLHTINNDYVNLFKDLKERGAFRIIIDCHVSRVKKILHAALKVHMVSEYYHYLFTTLDLGLVDLEDYKHGGANITSFRLINPDRRRVIDVRTEWLLEERRSGKSPLMGQAEIETETALVYDAVHLFARALHELSQAQDVTTSALSCDKAQSWNHGNSLLNYMKSMNFDGLSGNIRYEKGERIDFTLDVLELAENGLRKIGAWSRIEGVNITQDYAVKKQDHEKALANHTLAVVVKLDEPYVIKRGEGDYIGFCIDLLNMIAERKNFSVTIREADAYGSQKNGQWDGIVGELVDRKADIGLGGMSITHEREQVIDFTKPFLTLGITILFAKPTPKAPQLFSFLSPLSVEVWVYMIAAYLCVSFMLFVIARFSPYEWCNPHPCNENADVVENQFTILNSLWFTIGSLMQQGCEIAPRAISTRLIAGIWWFFTLIMISSYTANLAAFLTVERMISPITSAEDLAKQSTISYGTQRGGSTMSFFANSKIDTFKRMWNFMNSSSDNFVSSNAEGVRRVKEGGYAYLAESTAVEYTVERNCELEQVGGLLDSKGYGIATPRNSPYRELITETILKLQEEQEIHRLHSIWWEQYGKALKCEQADSASKSKAAELGVDNVGGVFVVLMGGVGAGFVVSLCEFIWKARKNAREDQQTLCSEMAEEFRFAVRCVSSKKPSKNRTKDVTDNGLQFMPLTGYGHNSVGGKEVYA